MKKLTRTIIIIIPFTVILLSYYFITRRSENTKMNMAEIKSANFKYSINPVAKHGDFADPFIMKYNGKYYLYCTNPGVKCWSSTNLVDWEDEGTVIKGGELYGLVPYAPEVVYWNGFFYMYTSPSGKGHYILKSESPTGPFTVQTDNLGHSIDGSVFIDDDGKWYFYCANLLGIKAYTMEDPLTIGKETATGAFMNGWTEGPGVIKKNNKYYMTYTGNHYLSPGYRINYAVSDKSPVEGFVPYLKNPFLINTQGKGIGLGHNMSFIGPDLDSWYITYHNLNPDRTRDLNIDRLAWNGDKMVVFGPTVSKQVAPEMPDFYDYFDRSAIGNKWIVKNGDWQIVNGLVNVNTGDSSEESKILSEFASGENYTVEFNLKLNNEIKNSNSRIGGIISYKDDKNYGVISLNPNDNTVETRFIINGKEEQQQASVLPEGYDFSKLHCIRVEKWGNQVEVFVDGMHKQTRNVPGLQGGNIGLLSRGCGAAFGYTALSNNANGESVFNAFKPVPGTIEAVHYNEGGENVGYKTENNSNNENNFRKDGFYIETCKEGGYNTALREKGEWLAYNINVDKTGVYNLDLRAAEVTTGTKVKIWCDNEEVLGAEKLDVEQTKEWRTISLAGLKLKEGPHTLRVELEKGSFKLYTLSFYEAAVGKPEFKENFQSDLSKWTYVTGLGKESVLKDGAVQLGSYGKIAAGEDGWMNYSVEVDVKGDSNLNSGVIFRVSNPAEGGECKDCTLGTNFYQGYFAGITSNGVVLLKQNYNKQELASTQESFKAGKSYHLKIVANGGHIKVFVDNMSKPKIDYFDSEPFTHGKAGIRTEGAMVYFKNFKVSGKLK